MDWDEGVAAQAASAGCVKALPSARDALDQQLLTLCCDLVQELVEGGVVGALRGCQGGRTAGRSAPAPHWDVAAAGSRLLAVSVRLLSGSARRDVGAGMRMHSTSPP